jgi:regulator of nonsense transcripts 3
LTKAEFENAVGDDWKAGAGKVDWFSYKKGKITKDAAKPSRPSRAYFHVIKQDFVTQLGDHVRALTFHDAAKSWQDPALVGAPTLEFAPYPKMPGGRRRNDNRQGTIDQDQDFKDFLESLTNPISKPAAPEGEQAKDTKVKTTPLIEALREKKANKEKPNKGRSGRGDKDATAEKKILTKAGKENAQAAGDKNRRSGKADKAQATKEAVKILNKEASTSKNANATADKASGSPAPERKRGNVALAKSMLQRDLGVGPGPAPNRRRGTKREVASGDTATPAKDAPAAESKPKDAPAAQGGASPADKAGQASQKKERPTRAERRAFKASLADTTNSKAAPGDAKPQVQGKAPASPAPQILKKPQAAQTPTAPKGPAASRTPTEPAATRTTPGPAKAQGPTPSATPSAPAARSTPPKPVPDATSKQAFLKHANPSQGITEPLIEEALKVFGALDKVEIDKRKGFAYVDFAEPEGLQKAMAASPIKIAQGAVQVLERKAPAARPPRFNAPPQGPPHGPPHGPPTGPARGGRGGFGPRGRGRGGARGGANTAAAPAPASGPSTPAPVAPAAAPPAPAPTPAAGPTT